MSNTNLRFLKAEHSEGQKKHSQSDSVWINSRCQIFCSHPEILISPSTCLHWKSRGCHTNTFTHLQISNVLLDEITSQQRSELQRRSGLRSNLGIHGPPLHSLSRATRCFLPLMWARGSSVAHPLQWGWSFCDRAMRAKRKKTE